MACPATARRASQTVAMQDQYTTSVNICSNLRELLSRAASVPFLKIDSPISGAAIYLQYARHLSDGRALSQLLLSRKGFRVWA
jgi:hypothetical protein